MPSPANCVSERPARETWHRKTPRCNVSPKRWRPHWNHSTWTGLRKTLRLCLVFPPCRETAGIHRPAPSAVPACRRRGFLHRSGGVASALPIGYILGAWLTEYRGGGTLGCLAIPIRTDRKQHNESRVVDAFACRRVAAAVARFGRGGFDGPCADRGTDFHRRLAGGVLRVRQLLR